MIFIITGRPGVGKTTMVYDLSRRSRVRPCGFVTIEVREGGVRVGFKLVNLETNEEEVLSDVRISGSVRVGKYVVNVPRACDFMYNILSKCAGRDFVVIDEVGPMELKCPNLLERIKAVASKAKVSIITAHRYEAKKLADSLGAELIELTPYNRDAVRERLEKLLTSSPV